jgi:hypothetical protein
MVVFKLVSKKHTKHTEVLHGVQLLIILYVELNSRCQHDSVLKNFISFVSEMRMSNCAIFCST